MAEFDLDGWGEYFDSTGAVHFDPAVLDGLPSGERVRVTEILASIEGQVRANPLLRYVPHVKQVEFHSSREPLKVFFGGNRSGKTTAGICDDLIQAVDLECLPERLRPYKRWDPPFKCRIVCPDFTEQLEGVILPKLREWTPKEQLVGGSFEKAYDKQRRRLSFKNGSVFSFMTFEQDPDKFGGAALHRVHYDEEPPDQIRKECEMRLVDHGGDELFTMTPLHGLSWTFKQLWEPHQKGRLRHSTVVVVDMDDNPHLNREAKERVLAKYTDAERQARKSGRFVHFAGTIYDAFSPHTHVIPELQELPANVLTFVGIDPGIRHLAGVVWVYLSAMNGMVVFDELALQGHTIGQVAEAIKLVNAKYAQTVGGVVVPLRPRWYVIDPSARNLSHQTGRSDQMEFSDHGIATILGQNSVTAGINRVRERLEAKPPALLVTANCKELIDEFPNYRWKTPSRIENDAKEQPIKTDDHLLDALRYVVMSRPYKPEDLLVDQRNLSPLERAAIEDQSGRRQPVGLPQTDMGGIYV